MAAGTSVIGRPPATIAADRTLDATDKKLSLAHIAVAYATLLVGAIAGVLQVCQRAGFITLPGNISYYEVLTVHGVLLGLVFTTFFIVGFLYSSVSKTIGSLSSKAISLGWVGFWTMLIGVVIAAVTILDGQASVLFTFYVPLKASPFFYIGATLLVVGSWLACLAIIVDYKRWRKAHPGQLSPLPTFMVVVTVTLWIMATLGLAVTVLFQMIPWSFGWVPTINVELSRTLFWYFGHPLVYFWLMPAYIAWYNYIPKIIGGKIFSDSLSRLSFILLWVLSMPIGAHHQLMDAGIPADDKWIFVLLTLTVAVPSLMTAFALFATFEISGRAKGATGLMGWVKKLPWGDARFFAPMIGMIVFMPAGAGGIVNTSMQLDQVVHNTLWVTGHFHITLATAVILTYFGTSYWMIPVLSGRTLTKSMNRLGIIQTWTWLIGMILMSGSMHTLGVMGAPRRTAYTTYFNNAIALKWLPYEQVMAVGGIILFIGVLLVVYIMINLMFFAPKGEEEFPVGEVLETEGATPKFLENWTLWILIAVALIVAAYTPVMMSIFHNSPVGSPGFKTW